MDGAADSQWTSCRFAEFFRALGEPELGALLVCEAGIDIAAAGGDEVTFSRSQTLMRYKFALEARL